MLQKLVMKCFSVVLGERIFLINDAPCLFSFCFYLFDVLLLYIFNHYPFLMNIYCDHDAFRGADEIE